MLTLSESEKKILSGITFHTEEFILLTFRHETGADKPPLLLYSYYTFWIYAT